MSWVRETEAKTGWVGIRFGIAIGRMWHREPRDARLTGAAAVFDQRFVGRVGEFGERPREVADRRPELLR